MKAQHVLGCVGTALVLLLASVWIPVVGPFFSLLTPLPFLYYSAKLGVSQAVKFTCASILASGVIAAATWSFPISERSIAGTVLNSWSGG
jgi:uncharacterized protein YybS (DUF2232 family)